MTGMTLLGCIACGLVLERDQDVGEQHLAGETCPDCDQHLRAVGVEEAAQLTRERYLAEHWRRLAAQRKRERGLPA